MGENSAIATFEMLLFAVLSIAPHARSQQQARAEQKVATLVQRSHQAVVSVVASDEHGAVLAQGTGFVASANGLVVTNFHIIRNCSAAVVKFETGATYTARGFLGVDRGKDLAILKVNGNQLPTPRRASESARLWSGCSDPWPGTLPSSPSASSSVN